MSNYISIVYDQTTRAPFPENAMTASAFISAMPYSTITTSSTNWVTCSFADSNEVVNITTPLLYSFTSSNHPVVGKFSDVLLYINNTSVATSSLSFPTLWKSLGNAWPTSITASKVAVVWLRAIDTNTVVGTYNLQN